MAGSDSEGQKADGLKDTGDDLQDVNNEPKSPIIPFAEFLEEVGSSQERTVTELWRRNPFSEMVLQTPEILTHCWDNLCNGPRIFRCTEDKIEFFRDKLSIYVTYRCSNCENKIKRYSLYLEMGSDGGGRAYKYGELPPFGPPTPSRLLRLFGVDREYFLKGRRCEAHGLGVGAFVYYRRVVENHRKQIMDEIIKVAEKVGAKTELIEGLKTAKGEIQFSKSVETIKPGIPESLLIDGQNPLTLLHSALSRGVHEMSDQECLQLAHDVRIVLIELAERIARALSDQQDLKTAVSRLMAPKT